MLMSQASLYDVLLVNQNATLDEIKLAFKKRALQVHPDKGGSKDAFHLVYQALEILADPEARQKYDQSLSRVNRRSEVDLQQTSPAGKKKTSKKRTQPSGQRETCPQPKRPTEPKKKPTADAGSTGNEPEANQPPQSKQTKLVKRIRDLLKQLPRDLRNDAITKHFSQKQRLILEKWMVDTLSASQEGETVVTTNQAASVRDIPTIETPNGLLYHGSCHTPFLPSVPSLPSLPSLPAVSNSYRPNMSRMSRKKTAECKMKDSKDPNAKMRRTTGSGYLKKQGVSYAAGLCFDAIDIYTKTCDLQTSLEYLLVLTAVKQKMRDPESASASCEERLQGALMSSAKEHGKDPLLISIFASAFFRPLDFLSNRDFFFAPQQFVVQKNLESFVHCWSLFADMADMPFLQARKTCSGGLALLRCKMLGKSSKKQWLMHGTLPGQTALVFCKKCVPFMKLKLNTEPWICKSGNGNTWHCKIRISTALQNCEKGMALPTWSGGSGSKWPWRTRTNTAHKN